MGVSGDLVAVTCLDPQLVEVRGTIVDGNVFASPAQGDDVVLRDEGVAVLLDPRVYFPHIQNRSSLPLEFPIAAVVCPPFDEARCRHEVCLGCVRELTRVFQWVKNAVDCFSVL